MNIKGKIKNKELQNGETNGRKWTRCVFELTDGKKYATFDKDLFDFKEGDSVEIFGEMNGNFFKVEAITRIPDIVEEAPAKAHAKSTPRSSHEITATELLRYSVKLVEAKNSLELSEAQKIVWSCYSKFLTQLQNDATSAAPLG